MFISRYECYRVGIIISNSLYLYLFKINKIPIVTIYRAILIMIILYHNNDGVANKKLITKLVANV